MNGSKHVRKIVIVGGGTAGWMTAVTFARHLGDDYDIQLIESEEIGIVGVGEASIPGIRRFNDNLGITEADFLGKTQGTFKLGIQFEGWGKPDQSYFHSFGEMGSPNGIIPFYQYWLRHAHTGNMQDLWDVSAGARAALQDRFGKTNTAFGESANDFNYAYHFDSHLYGKFLRRVAQINGVKRVEGKIVDVALNAENGFIDSVIMEDSTSIAADLFIDCSGFAALLIGKALGSEYEDWSNYLPCNRALAVPSKSTGALKPYTKSTARAAGWQWRIPLQHRTGNGHVYCSDFISDDEATQTLLDGLDGEALAEPRQIKFVTGKRKQFWRKNCIAIGLAGGFMEPLESTSIHLVQTAIMRLLNLFPTKEFHQSDIDKFNSESDVEFSAIRDFLILHYHVNQREGMPFWDRCREMTIPDTLTDKIALFKSNGRIIPDLYDLFAQSSWLQVMLGQGLFPQSHHPLADQMSAAATKAYIQAELDKAQIAVRQLPLHSEYISKLLAG